MTTPHSASPEIRFKPSRAGVIGLWDYDDEEFVFADGRLVLRGHNGSGKTKALEVLFPFLLDGNYDPRRLDPFSGAERTMKSNLLYRGQDSGYGYVWMEFTRTTESGEVLEAVTIAVGLVATKAKERPGRIFVVTDGRVGLDFGLLGPGGRPLRSKELEKVLGRDAMPKSPTQYQDAVDRRLFGLGRERYAQLVNLLLQLRRPLLAKDLDPEKLSDTLTAGLRPVDEALVAQAATAFDDLAEIQAETDALTTADNAVQTFLRDYTTYLRAQAGDRADRLQARLDATAQAWGRCAETEQQRRIAQAAEEQASGERAAAKKECDALAARLRGITDNELLKAHGALTERRTRIDADARTLKQLTQRLDGDRRHVEGLTVEAGGVAEELAGVTDAAQQHLAALIDAAGRALIGDDDALGPEEEPLSWAKACSAARGEDLRQVREKLQAAEQADASRKRAELAAEAAQQAEKTRNEEHDRSLAELERARSMGREALGEFLARWSTSRAAEDVREQVVLTSDDQAPLLQALESAADPVPASLPETLRSLTQARHRRAEQRPDDLEREHTRLRGEADQREADRKAIAEERDDSPPAETTRAADRTSRPGAPLWQLVRFADALAEPAAASLEAALHAAGLLTAWIHPDPTATSAALASGEDDGYLLPLPQGRRPTGRTLADALLPEHHADVTADAVTAVLASIALADHASEADAVPTQLTPSGHYRLGILAGTHAKPHAEYIGATARARRRVERLAELDRQIADLKRALGDIEQQQEQVRQHLADFEAAHRDLPATAPITEAAGRTRLTASRLADARTHRDEADRAHDKAVGEAHTQRRALHQAATQRNLPATADELAAVAHALTDLREAAKDLHAARTRIPVLEHDLDNRRDTISARTGQLADDTLDLEQRRARHQADVEELKTAEESLDAPVRALRDQEAALRRQVGEAETAYTQADKRARRLGEELVAHRTSLSHLSEALTTALTEQLTIAEELEPLAHPDLLRLLGGGAAPAWTPSRLWPSAARAAEALTARLADPDSDPCETDPEAAAAAALPPAALDLLGALQQASRGRTHSSSAVKGATSKLDSALGILEAALAGIRGQRYHLAWDTSSGLVLATVTDEEGPAPVADFALRLTEELATQRVLLDDRERNVMEDALLGGLAQQIHSRTVEARELVAKMDADTRSKPMSSGMRIGIRWAPADTLSPSQREVVALLKRDAASLGSDGLAELRSHLRTQIRAGKAGDPRKDYRKVIGEVLDYRQWRTFEILVVRPGEAEEKLTRAKHTETSGGEKSSALHLPLFAAANAQYGSARSTCPRLIALDEAFAGIDERYRPDLLGLTVTFDLDLFMTGHDLWITYPDVPQVAHYDLRHDKASHTVSALLMLWDGEQIHEDLGFADSHALATEILGFRPTRRSPVTDGLLTDEPADESATDEDDHFGEADDDDTDTGEEGEGQ